LVQIFLILGIFALFSLSGCASNSHRYEPRQQGQVAQAYDRELADQSIAYFNDQAEGVMLMEEARPPAKLGKRRGSMNAGFHGGSAGISGPPLPKTQNQPPHNNAELANTELAAQARKVHYSGNLSLRSSRPKDILDTAEALTLAVGGFVEQRHSTRIELRVPADSFQVSFERLQNLAEVLHKSIRAADVTEQFQDVELRIKLRKASIAKLKEMIARSQDEKEKLELLSELKRATEDLQRLELQMKTLSSLADFSRITLLVQEARPTAASQNTPKALRWIEQLDPFQRNKVQNSKALEFKTPPLMVDLSDVGAEKSGAWRAAGSEGAEVWAWERNNKPQGSTQFWADAVYTKLKEQFRESSRRKLGKWEILRFLPWDERDPYRYLIALKVVDDKLSVVQIYLPDQEREEKHLKNIEKMLQEGSK